VKRTQIGVGGGAGGLELVTRLGARYGRRHSVMGNLVGGRMAIEGRLARFVHMSLYRMHLLAIHAWLRGTALILVGHVARILRPRLKLH
jgi:NADH dehydrogenase